MLSVDCDGLHSSPMITRSRQPPYIIMRVYSDVLRHTEVGEDLSQLLSPSASPVTTSWLSLVTRFSWRTGEELKMHICYLLREKARACLYSNLSPL